MEKEVLTLPGKSFPSSSFPFEELHWMLQLPTFILVEEGWVDKDFELLQHNEVWEKAYPIRHKSTEALGFLYLTCLGRKLSEENMTRLEEIHAENV